MNEQIQNPKKIRFTPEITLGNILQLLSIAAAVVGLWINMDKRISAMEVRENYAMEERHDLKVSISTLSENQAVMARTVDRISILLDQHIKGESYEKLILIDLVVIASAMFLCGCNLAPLKGGRATTSGVIGQTVVQGDNPAQASRQDQETVMTRSCTVPAGSRMEESHVTANAAGATITNVQSVVVSAPMAVAEHEETRAKTELGAAQKDTARELGAKLASLKGIVWVGVILFLFGLATFFYPPVKLLIGSVITSAAICAGGLALIILPTLTVGNELLILAGVAATVGLWFLAHRHGQLRGLVDAAKESK